MDWYETILALITFFAVFYLYAKFNQFRKRGGK